MNRFCWRWESVDLFLLPIGIAQEDARNIGNRPFFQVDLYSMLLLIERVILDLIVFTFFDCAEGMNNSVPKRINSELRDPQEILSFQITLAVSIQSKKPANKEFMLLNVLIFLHT